MDERIITDIIKKVSEEFDSMSNEELLSVILNPEYDGLYHNITDMTYDNKEVQSC